MEFQWDPAKAQSNLQKHGIAFEDVIQIFYDPLTLREQPSHTSDSDTKPAEMVRLKFDTDNPPALTVEQIARLEQLRDRPPGEYDPDNPPLTDEFFKNAIRNPYLYPPVRMSADVVEFFSKRVGDEGSIMMEINHVLLDYIAAEKKKAVKKAG